MPSRITPRRRPASPLWLDWIRLRSSKPFTCGFDSCRGHRKTTGSCRFSARVVREGATRMCKTQGFGKNGGAPWAHGMPTPNEVRQAPVAMSATWHHP